MSPHEAVDLIGRAKGLAVLAHPGLSHHLGTYEPTSESLVAKLAERGLAGLEVDHPDHAPDVRVRLRALAKSLGLVATGGSDFHGESGRPIADCTTTEDAFRRLEAVAADGRQA
jgi:predicted metal-dependent phosphoesterase TrpH